MKKRTSNQGRSRVRGRGRGQGQARSALSTQPAEGNHAKRAREDVAVEEEDDGLPEMDLSMQRTHFCTVLDEDMPQARDAVRQVC